MSRDGSRAPAASGTTPALAGADRTAYEAWMQRALQAAAGAPAGGDVPADEVPAAGDVPVGAVVVDGSGAVIASAGNEREASGDPTAHAEIVALRRAAERLGRWRLGGTTLVVTLEPCTMCAGAAVLARVDRIVFGAWDPKAGAVGSLWDVVRDRRLNHRPEVIGGVLADRCAAQLRRFFDERRD